MVIAYFLKSETNFTHNGLGILDNDIISPVVTEEINGIFKLEFDYPTHATHGNNLIPERIIRCPVPNMPDQLFRIAEREAAIGGIFHVVAYHVFYDLVQNIIEDTFIVNRNGAQAMSQILGATQYTHGFSSSSNIGTYNNARMVRLNVAEAILDGGTANSFISRWGGEIIRDNFFISMQSIRGSDNGVSIRDKKNLTGYRSNVDFGTVVTRIMPQGFDGLFLPEKYIDSPLIGNYQTPRIRILKYDKVKAAVGQYAEDEEAVPLSEALLTLRTLAAKEYSANRIDQPNASYKVEFAPLERTEEYKNFTTLETINIGDTVKVVHEEDDLDITARMISYTYNPLVKAYIAVNLGNAEPKFTSTVSEMRSMAVDAVMSAAENGLIVLPSAGNNRAVNYYGSMEPPNPRIGDLWFKENGDKLELWIYETRDGVTQWYALLSDLMFEEMRQELADAVTLVEEAKAKAEEAFIAGEDAKAAGEEAKVAAEEAKIAGEEALTAGQQALEAGQEALEVGKSAQSTADQAVAEAQEAVSKANQAFDDATFALNSAGNAASQAETANITAGNAYNKSVKSTAVTYAVSSSGVTAPSSGWQTSIPTTVAGQFLWTRTVITLQDNTGITSYSIAKHGETGTGGTAGPAGKGISSTTITYQASVSGTSTPTGTWQTTIPSVLASQYLWTRTIITYSDNTTSTSYSVGMMGAKGDTGATGKGISTTAIAYRAGTSGTTIPSGTWTASIPSVAASQYLWTRTIITYTDNTTSTSYSVGMMGAKGDKGDKGDTGTAGTPAPTITMVREQYYLSTSRTTQSGGSWLDTVAAWVNGRFYWTRVASTFSNGTTTYSMPVLADALNNSLVTALEARTLSQSLQTTVTQHATSISLNASNVTSLTTRLTTAEASLIVQAGQIASKANQTTVDTLTGCVTAAESSIIQNAESFTLSLAKQSKAVNELAGASILQTAWQQGNLSTSTGAESNSASYVRSGWFDVNAGKRYLLQTYEGISAFSVHGTATLFYYRADKTFLSSTSNGNSTTPFTVPANAVYLRIRYTTTAAPSTINCYLLQTENVAGYANLTNLTSMVKLQATSDSLLVTVTETVSAIGIPFKVQQWERGNLSTSTGEESASNSYLRSGYIAVTSGERYISQLIDGTAVSMVYFYYTNTAFLSSSSTSGAVMVPANCTRMRIRVTTSILPDVYTGNIYASTTRQDYSKGNTLYSALLMQKDLINLRVGKDNVINQINISTEGILIAGDKIRITGTTTIDNAVIQTAAIANLAVSTAKIADLAVSTAKIANLAVSAAKIANLAVGTAQIANAAITNAKIGSLAVNTAQIANAAITDAKIANLSAAKITTGTLSADRIAAGSITSAKLTIANGFITNAMIANATIQSAKIAAIDAAKITTGVLAAARIGAGSITADKVTTNFLQTLTGSASIRITGTTISYYNGSALTSQINASGFELTRDNVRIGRIGTNNISGQSSWRGLVFDLENAGNYMSWTWRETASASTYSMRLTYYRSRLQNGMERGFHFNDEVFFKGGLSVASGSSRVTNNVSFWTFSSTSYLARTTTNNRAGVALGGSNLLLGSQGTWVDFNSIRAICAAISGKRVYLPASSGGLSSWWDVTIPSLSTWST